MPRITFIVGMWPKNKNRNRRAKRVLSVLIVGLLFVTAIWSGGSLLAGLLSTGSHRAQSALSRLVDLKAWMDSLSIQPSFYEMLLRQGIPLMQSDDIEKEISPAEIIETAVMNLTSVDVRDPKTFFESQFSYAEDAPSQETVASAEPSGFDVQQGSESETTGEGAGNGEDSLNQTPTEGMETLNGGGEASAGAPTVSSVGDNPSVGIYNTHNAECYLPSSGAERKEGEDGDVVTVAGVLENTLVNTYGVPVVRSTKIHDYPDWNLSYGNSKETATQMLAENPSIQILVDVHRDAGLGEKQVVTVDGKKAAKILIIVGSNQRLDHPNWEKNKQFADGLNDKIEKLYPGLSRGVRVQEGRYNQHLHPHAILVEIGSVQNTLQEAEYSAEMLARVFAAVLKDMTADTL